MSTPEERVRIGNELDDARAVGRDEERDRVQKIVSEAISALAGFDPDQFNSTDAYRWTRKTLDDVERRIVEGDDG